MKKIIFNIIFSLFFCIILNTVDIWLFFTPIYFMMEGRQISENAMWEIPMGALLTQIALIFSFEYEPVLLRILILVSAAVISVSAPKKLLVFFPAAILSLLVNAESGTAIIVSCLWCGIRAFFLSKKVTLAAPRPS